MHYDKLRQLYMQQGLGRDQMDANPFKVFATWYASVIDSEIPEPTAMSIATVDDVGQPWQRMVLLKYYDEDGFVFFTNYSSRKAGHIEKNNKVSLLFPWHALGRQVKITGTAAKISNTESFKYFVTRPRGSQIGAWASPQSKVITSRSLLEAKVEEIRQKFKEGEVPIPSFWGGYRVSPQSMEFWQARENRLHDRFIYTCHAPHEWKLERLAP
jgi:pyridoxamine 5'-phosphate oxidase